MNISRLYHGIASLVYCCEKCCAYRRVFFWQYAGWLCAECSWEQCGVPRKQRRDA